MIDILLPVYNGEKYLREQIESILHQSYPDWKLLIRNDGSTDGSDEIIRRFCAKYPDKIFQIYEPSSNIGLVESLNILLHNSSSEYVMFADQDDVWLNDKLELSLSQMLYLETANLDKPIMICTDVKCVNNEMEILHESFFKSMRFIDGVVGNVEKMLALNEVQGCTIMINRTLIPFIYPIPKFMKIHDMWIGIHAANFGKAEYLHHQTLLYRQHDSNTVGAIEVGRKYYFKRFGSSMQTILQYMRIKSKVKFEFSIFRVFYYKFKFMFVRLRK